MSRNLRSSFSASLHWERFHSCSGTILGIISGDFFNGSKNSGASVVVNLEDASEGMQAHTVGSAVAWTPSSGWSGWTVVQNPDGEQSQQIAGTSWQVTTATAEIFSDRHDHQWLRLRANFACVVSLLNGEPVEEVIPKLRNLTATQMFGAAAMGLPYSGLTYTSGITYTSGSEIQVDLQAFHGIGTAQGT